MFSQATPWETKTPDEPLWDLTALKSGRGAYLSGVRAAVDTVKETFIWGATSDFSSSALDVHPERRVALSGSSLSVGHICI